MFSGSLIVLLLVAFFLSDASGQSSTAMSVTASASSRLEPTPASSAISPSPSQPSKLVPSSSDVSAAPTSVFATAAPTTEPTVKPTCAVLSVIFRIAWDERLTNTSSNEYKAVELVMSLIFQSLYNDFQKYEHINVSGVKLTKSKDGLFSASMNLCLVVKTNDGAFVEDVFKDKVKTGTLYGNLAVISDSAGFEPLGVTFKDWKAKDGECDKCKGAGGEFVIEGTCVAKASSCRGLKNTKMTNDCVTYCNSSAVTIAVSSVIFAMGIFLSLSFQ